MSSQNFNETEWKFLVDVTNPAVESLLNFGDKTLIFQGYVIDSDQGILRARMVSDFDGENTAYFTTYKGRGLKDRVEIETQIPEDHFQAFIKQCNYIIKKVRVEFLHYGIPWSLDFFLDEKNAGLVLLEHEKFTIESYNIILPEFATVEVTDKKIFANSNMSKGNGILIDGKEFLTDVNLFEPDMFELTQLK